MTEEDEAFALIERAQEAFEAAQKRHWQGLEEIDVLRAKLQHTSLDHFANIIESVLKRKNYVSN
jgi:hypothetical protein